MSETTSSIAASASPELAERGVLLVSCYELGHPPLSIAWPAAFLREAGLSVRVLDLSVDAFRPDLLRGVSLVAVAVPMLTALRLGVDAAARVRAASPSAHIAFFGLYAWLNRTMLLERRVADSVLAGESEQALADLAQALAKGRDVSRVPGLSTRDRQQPPVRQRLAFPVPDRRDLPPLSRYARYLGGAEPPVLAGSVEASRGCLHTCRHCPVVPVYGGRFFVVPQETVLADIRQQIEAGARHITFADPDFLNGPGHAMKIVRALSTEFSGVTFDFTTKVEHIVKHSALFPEFSALGCRFVISAVESLSDRVLHELRKGHTRADVVQALAVLDAAGIALQPTFVAFTPWTSLDDYIDSLEFIREQGLTRHVPPVQLSIRLLVPPGSLLEQAEDAPQWLGALEPHEFRHAWRHPDPRMDTLYESVAARVELAAERDEPADATWAAVRALAYGAAGRAIPQADAVERARPVPPRLSEAWFCCAEPRRVQVGLVKGGH
jgi:radical SAM superfamily enzyme YgiQ (UPF0313 family)